MLPNNLSQLTDRQRLFAQRFGLNDPRGAIPSKLGATAIVNNDVLDDARVGFRAAFLQQLEAKPDPAEALALEVPSTHRSEQWNLLGDIPGFEEWIGDRTLSDLAALKLPRLENRKFSNGIRVKRDDFADDALGLVPASVQGLAIKARRHRADQLAKLLLNGFDGTAYPDVGDGLAYDGEFFFSDSHTGGNDNKHTAAFGANGLAAAEQMLAEMKTLDGETPLALRGTHIVVGPKNEAAAIKLLSQEYLAAGESNVNRGRYTLIVSPNLRGTYDDYWFLADLGQAYKPLLLQMREEINMEETGPEGLPAFSGDELWFGARARYNVGYFEPRLIVGSTGAG